MVGVGVEVGGELADEGVNGGKNAHHIISTSAVKQLSPFLFLFFFIYFMAQMPTCSITLASRHGTVTLVRCRSCLHSWLKVQLAFGCDACLNFGMLLLWHFLVNFIPFSGFQY